MMEEDEVDGSALIQGIYYSSKTIVCKECGKNVRDELEKIGRGLGKKAAAINFLRNGDLEQLTRLLDEVGK